MAHLLATLDRRADEIRKLALLFGLILLSWPLPIRPIVTALDPSWMAGINWASAHGIVFGRDAMFTYGPLGFTLCPVDCATEHWRWVAVAGQLCLYGLWWLSAGMVLAHIQDREDELLFLAAALMASFTADAGCVVTMTVLGFLVVALRRDSLTGALVAGGVAGCSLLIKFNLGLSCCGAVLAWFLVTAGREPWKRALGRGMALGSAMACALVVANWACGGGWADLVRFVGYSLRISADYSSQMAQRGPPWAALYLLAVVLILATLVAQGAVRKTSGWGMAAILLVPALFEYKRAVTRMDIHHWLPGILGMAGIVVHLLVWRAAPRERQVIRWCVRLNCLMAGLVIIRYWRHRPEATVVVLTAVLEGLILGVTTLRSWGFQLSPRWNERLRVWCAGLGLTAILAACTILAIAATHPTYPARFQRHLPPGAMNFLKLMHLNDWLTRAAPPRRGIPDRMLDMIGEESIDAYQTDISTVLLYKLNYQPRSMFQSYQAYCPLLDAASAEYYAGHEGPRFILYSYNSTIDSTHPWMVDPLTWREIYRWYDRADESDDLMLLKRRSTPRWNDRLPPSEEFQITFGETLAIPKDDAHRLLKARIQLTAAGKLARVLFRVVPPTIRVEYRSGMVGDYRLVWQNAASGILINDLPQDSAANSSFFRGTGSTGARSITFMGDARYFAREIDVSWEILPAIHHR